MGRTTRLEPQIQEFICNLIRAGNYFKAAAQAAGVDRTTLQKWCERGGAERARQMNGEDPTPLEVPYLDFLEAVETARAEADARHVRNIDMAGSNGDWKASAWLLERRNPKQWGPRERVEHSGPGGGPIRFATRPDLSKLTDEELDDLERLTAKINPAGSGDPGRHPGGESPSLPP